MSHSRILLPCGHPAAYRDADPEEGVYLNHCDFCDWRPGHDNEHSLKVKADRELSLQVARSNGARA